VIIVDTRLDEELVKSRGARYAAFIGSDNYEGGRVAARFIARKLDGRGNVVLLEGIAGALTGDLRKQGFMDALKDYPGLKLVASQTADMERGKGFDVTQNILQAHPDVQGIFACNDLMALGAVEAVDQAGKKGGVVIVGFDATDDARKAILEGKMAGSIAQYPSAMGEAAVENAVKLIRGEGIPAKISTKIEIITKEMLEKAAKR
jgi:ribose transport system substrate-binding protein